MVKLIKMSTMKNCSLCY